METRLRRAGKRERRNEQMKEWKEKEASEGERASDRRRVRKINSLSVIFTANIILRRPDGGIYRET